MGGLFTAWKDGARAFNHSGYYSEMKSQGQPPLGFYLRVVQHLLPRQPQAAGTAVVVTSPDRAYPVAKALTYQAQQVEMLLGGASSTPHAQCALAR